MRYIATVFYITKWVIFFTISYMKFGVTYVHHLSCTYFTSSFQVKSLPTFYFQIIYRGKTTLKRFQQSYTRSVIRLSRSSYNFARGSGGEVLWWARLCVCVCLSAAISPERHAQPLPNFCACCLWPWLGSPPAGRRNTKGMGQFGCFFSIDNALYNRAFWDPYKNDWSDRDAVWDDDSGGS